MDRRAELIDRKRKLYAGFLDMPTNELSESDLKVMMALMKDADIQALLDKALGEAQALRWFSGYAHERVVGV